MRVLLPLCAFFLSGAAFASTDLISNIVPFSVENADADAVVLHNDSFKEGGGQAYLQLGFVKGEKVGVWVKVPAAYEYFKIDAFRILIGSSDDIMDSSEDNTQIFFQMGVASKPSANMPRDIENAAQVTAGPYWNDIPAKGGSRQLSCAKGGEFIGAAMEFMHSGSPSVYRDLDNIQPMLNTLFAIPGGWKQSISYGLRGDWILRVVGREATKSECGL